MAIGTMTIDLDNGQQLAIRGIKDGLADTGKFTIRLRNKDGNVIAEATEDKADFLRGFDIVT
jgi:hypothetical protein